MGRNESPVFSSPQHRLYLSLSGCGEPAVKKADDPADEVVNVEAIAYVTPPVEHPDPFISTESRYLLGGEVNPRYPFTTRLAQKAKGNVRVGDYSWGNADGKWHVVRSFAVGSYKREKMWYTIDKHGFKAVRKYMESKRSLSGGERNLNKPIAPKRNPLPPAEKHQNDPFAPKSSPYDPFLPKSSSYDPFAPKKESE